MTPDRKNIPERRLLLSFSISVILVVVPLHLSKKQKKFNFRNGRRRPYCIWPILLFMTSASVIFHVQAPTD